MYTLIAVLIWLTPFAVAAWLISVGFSPWIAFAVCAALLFFVAWGFAAPSAGSDDA